MTLFLVRHGAALSRYQDSQRALSSRGRADVQRVAARLADKKDVRVDRIYHSNKLRARQTAEILAERLHPSGGVSESDGLAPNDNPAVWTDRLIGEQTSLMLVGHLPHLARLAALLLVGNTEEQVASFPASGVACLMRDEQDHWRLLWTLGPDDPA